MFRNNPNAYGLKNFKKLDYYKFPNGRVAKIPAPAHFSFACDCVKLHTVGPIVSTVLAPHLTKPWNVHLLTAM